MPLYFMKNKSLITILIILSVISLFIGVKDMSVLSILEQNSSDRLIFIVSRIPRLLSIIITGSALSISGLIMQNITGNKFVSPSTAATMDSAKFGVLISLLYFTKATTLQKMIVSFLFAMFGTFIFMFILKKVKIKNIVIVPLIGIMLGNLIDSITSFISYKLDLIQNINSWLQGSFSMVIKGSYEILFIIVPLFIIAYLYANKFTIVGMGQDFTTNLGLNYNKIINIGLIIVSLITSAVLVTIGNIPFIGLIIPNLVSIYKGDNVENNILTVSLLGGNFLLFSDIISRLIIYPYEIPISLTAGILGSIIFLIIILKGVKK